MSEPTTYRPTEDCIDPMSWHVFDYGAHSASVESPFRCIVRYHDEPCRAVLIPAVPDGRMEAIKDAIANPPGTPEQEAIDNLGDEYPYLMMLLRELGGTDE